MAGWRGSLNNSRTGIALGIALQALLLGAYSHTSGAPRVVALAAVLLAIGVFRAAGARTSRTPWPASAPVWSVSVPVVLLGAACAWSAATWSEPRAAPSAGRALTVMTYNIQAGFDADDTWSLERTARAIAAQRPDVVVLQEVSRGWTDRTGADEALWLSRRLGLPFVFAPASRDGLWGNMVLSRLPVQESHILRYGEAAGRDRGALGVRLGTPSGDIWVLGTHLDAPKRAGAVRLRQARELIRFARGRSPALVLGDLNADSDDPALDALRAAGFRDLARALGAVTPTSADGRRIDYVLAGPRIDVLTVRVPRSAASDHLPVVAEVRLLPEE
jgi:endonuclease/exonuclease/phosphatase family metal-dependent hydrolase